MEKSFATAWSLYFHQIYILIELSITFLIASIEAILVIDMLGSWGLGVLNYELFENFTEYWPIRFIAYWVISLLACQLVNLSACQLIVSLSADCQLVN